MVDSNRFSIQIEYLYTPTVHHLMIIWGFFCCRLLFLFLRNCGKTKLNQKSLPCLSWPLRQVKRVRCHYPPIWPCIYIQRPDVVDEVTFPFQKAGSLFAPSTATNAISSFDDCFSDDTHCTSHGPFNSSITVNTPQVAQHPRRSEPATQGFKYRLGSKSFQFLRCCFKSVSGTSTTSVQDGICTNLMGGPLPDLIFSGVASSIFLSSTTETTQQQTDSGPTHLRGWITHTRYCCTTNAHLTIFVYYNASKHEHKRQEEYKWISAKIYLWLSVLIMKIADKED